MAIESERKVICPNCGGEFKEQSVKCPYCGTMYYPGAEEDYLKKLEHVRTDMEDLGAVPEQETVKAIKKRAGWVKQKMDAAYEEMGGWQIAKEAIDAELGIDGAR